MVLNYAAPMLRKEPNIAAITNGSTKTSQLIVYPILESTVRAGLPRATHLIQSHKDQRPRRSGACHYDSVAG